MPQTPAQLRAQTKYRETHHDRILAMRRERYRLDPEKHKAWTAKWRDRNPEKVKRQYRSWVQRNAKRRAEINRRSEKKRWTQVLATKRRYYARNRTRIREYFKRYLPAYRARLRASNPVFMLVERMRSRIRAVLAKVPVKKSKRTVDLIGCTPDQLRSHLENLFLHGMSWSVRHLIHVDHKRPLSSFDLRDPAQQREAFHYTNLQPLWAIDNRRKGSR